MVFLTKTNDSRCAVATKDNDIVSLSERWLLKCISSAELFDDRYVVYRTDRDYIKTNTIYGGGGLIAVKRKKLCDHT